MSRTLYFFVLALFMMPLFGDVTSNSEGGPVLTFAIYAPTQKSPPLHIVGFEYNEDAVKLRLTNDSDKPVIGATIVGFLVVPPACAAAAHREKGLGTVRSALRSLYIGPHQTAVTHRNSSLNPGDLVVSARNLKAGGYLQVQTGVVEVDFADGTAWKALDFMPDTPFDSSLVDADSEVKCSDISRVLKALPAVYRIEFSSRSQHGRSNLATQEKIGSTMPRVIFTCTLEGSKAICPSR